MLRLMPNPREAMVATKGPEIAGPETAGPETAGPGTAKCCGNRMQRRGALASFATSKVI